MAYGIGRHPAAREGGFHRSGSQLSVWHVFKRAAESADSGAGGADHEDVARGHRFESCRGWLVRSAAKKQRSAPAKGRGLSTSESVNADAEVVGASAVLKGRRLSVQLARQVVVERAAH